MLTFIFTLFLLSFQSDIISYQQQLAMMTMNRLDEMQVQEEKLDTAMALSEIRTQLQEVSPFMIILFN